MEQSHHYIIKTPSEIILPKSCVWIIKTIFRIEVQLLFALFCFSYRYVYSNFYQIIRLLYVTLNEFAVADCGLSVGSECIGTVNLDIIRRSSLRVKFIPTNVQYRDWTVKKYVPSTEILTLNFILIIISSKAITFSDYARKKVTQLMNLLKS